VFGREDHVSLAQHVERSATRHAVDCRDDRLPAVLGLRADQAPGILVRQRVEVEVIHARPVDTGAERLLTAAGKDDGANIGIQTQRLPDSSELVHHRGVKCVVDVGPVEHHSGDPFRHFERHARELETIRVGGHPYVSLFDWFVSTNSTWSMRSDVFPRHSGVLS